MWATANQHADRIRLRVRITHVWLARLYAYTRRLLCNRLESLTPVQTHVHQWGAAHEQLPPVAALTPWQQGKQNLSNQSHRWWGKTQIQHIKPANQRTGLPALGTKMATEQQGFVGTSVCREQSSPREKLTSTLTQTGCWVSSGVCVRVCVHTLSAFSLPLSARRVCICACVWLSPSGSASISHHKTQNAMTNKSD